VNFFKNGVKKMSIKENIKNEVTKKIGMGEILKGSKRLNNYLESIDRDLKDLQESFNINMLNFAEKLENIEKKLK
jgi:hypothetical protein